VQADPETRSTVPRQLGRYELITVIGQGGMAEVHLAVQRGPSGFEKLVVIKLVHEHLATQPALVEMLLDEGRLAGMIKHPNVVEIYDLGEADGRYFVAMEYLEGEPLLALLRAGADGMRLDPLSTARVIANTAEGLEAAHRLKSQDGKPLGLVHHDVSLGNIVVLYTGVVKLVDFGVAKARSADKHDRIQGKFGYMAPEKLTEGAEVDRRSDIWSLGVVAWEALTLSRLFKGEDDSDTVRQVLEAPIDPPSTINADVPEDFDPIVMRALERDPARRYSTAKAFALDLEDVLRKRGYGGKHERIASYMQATFAPRIAVRARLNQDLVDGKGPELLERSLAAFREATQTMPDDRPSVRSSDLLVEEGPRRDDRGGSGVEPLARRKPQIRGRRDLPYRKLLPFAIGAVVLLVIILATSGGGDDERPAPALASVPPPRPEIAPPVAPPIVAPVPTREPATPPPLKSEAREVGSGSAALATELDEIEMDPLLAVRPKRTVQHRSDTSAEALYARGLDLLRRGDAKAARGALDQALRANPNFAAAWYGLGLVHESLGGKGAAKSAYLRYLSLAPRAANAQQIRDRINRLH
jgi:serine/threonine-protein kinase